MGRMMMCRGCLLIVSALAGAFVVVWAPYGWTQGADRLEVLINELQQHPVVERMSAEKSSVTISAPMRDGLLRAMKKVAERLEKRYSLLVDPLRYDIMDLLDIEARMKMRHPSDSIEGLLGDLLTDEDLERNRALFAPAHT